MKRLLIILGIVLGLLLAFAFLAKQQGWIGGEDFTKVAIDQVNQEEIVGIVSASGKIHPQTEVKISPDVPGEIVELYVEEGDSVKVGEILMRLRPDDYRTAINRSISVLNSQKANSATAQAGVAQSQARLSQAQTNMQNAQKEYQRSQNLFNDELISQKELAASELAYNTTQADVKAAQQGVSSAQAGLKASEYNVAGVATDVKQARDSYNKTVVRAPTAGIIAALNVEKGERVVGTSQMQGTEMLSIANLSNMECRIEVSENDIVKVNIGDSAVIEVDAYYDEKFTGVVTQISNSRKGVGQARLAADQVTNFEVTVALLPESYAHLTGQEYPFRPGMSATVDIITDKINDKLTVPVQAVTARTAIQIEEMMKDTSSFSTKDKAKFTDGMTSQEKNERKEYVFVVRNGKIEIKPVKTGIQDDLYIIIEEGLAKGDSVVTAPNRAITKALKLGEEVDVVEEDKLYSK